MKSMMDAVKTIPCHCKGKGILRGRTFGKVKKYRYKCDKCGRWTEYHDTAVDALTEWERS